MTSASFRGLAALAAALMLTGCATEPESPELFFWVKPGVCAALPDSPCGADMTENAILTTGAPSAFSRSGPAAAA